MNRDSQISEIVNETGMNSASSFADLKIVNELDFGNIKARLFEGANGKQLVDIRQYFKERPTKKGIRIPIELYNVIKNKF